MDAPALILQLHGNVLRHASEVTGGHFEGVGVAAKSLYKSGLVDAALRKKLNQLDIAAAFVRHATRPKIDEFLQGFKTAVAKKIDVKGTDGWQAQARSVMPAQISHVHDIYTKQEVAWRWNTDASVFMPERDMPSVEGTGLSRPLFSFGTLMEKDAPVFVMGHSFDTEIVEDKEQRVQW